MAGVTMEIRIRETAQIVSENGFRAHVVAKGLLLDPPQSVNLPVPLTPAVIDTHGGDVVMATPRPQVGDYQSAYVSGAELVEKDGRFWWQQTWAIMDWEPEQIEQHKTQARLNQWELIKRERDRRSAGGVKVGDKWWHSDAESRIKFLALTMLGQNVPAGLQWKTMDGTFVEMTPTLAAQVFQANIMADTAIFAVAEAHRVAMEVAVNPATYNFMSDWPAIYGEEEDVAV